MITLLKTASRHWSQPAVPRRVRWVRRWKRNKGTVALLLTLLVLSTLAFSVEAARPDLATASHGPSSQEIALGSDLALEADLSWVQESQADLRGQTLEGAILTGADLSEADLSGADLAGATLLGTHLRKANLAGAVLRQADLHYAVLNGADLRGADLRGANLQWIDLQDADLRGAQLVYARVHRAYLHGATLPDGTRWMPGYDLDRFTDPRHSDFWSVRH